MFRKRTLDNSHGAQRISLRKYCFISAIILCAVCASAAFCAEESSIEKVLPAPHCAEGWLMEEKVALYTKDTLFERINGESELYFPYGFEALASARYANSKNPEVAVEVDVYKMGSLLDAFGIYANYRRADDGTVRIGAEGFVSPSQLLFYQDRYFVRLQASGTLSVEQEVFLSCARAVSGNLPRNLSQPRELELFMMPAVKQRSERYISQSLLGYAFFRRGLIADAVLEGEALKVFVVSEDSVNAARKAFDQYREYLKASGQKVQVTETPDKTSVTAVDPLYNNIYIEHFGRYLIGAVNLKKTSAGKQLVEQLRRRLTGDQGS
ncbi:MAG TPA: DUF6599 family protein [Thermodesulfovibrionales bacterium]|nr:DUF6599 family protein [Thermodesulfovibrionales bacterium]